MRLAIDAGGFVRSVEVIGDSDHGNGPAPVVGRDATSTRLAVLGAAASFAAGKAVAGTAITSNDVLKIAEAWTRWATTGNQEVE